MAKKAIELINKIASHLLRPIAVWVNTNASNVYGARFDLNDEKHHLPYRAKHSSQLPPPLHSSAGFHRVTRFRCQKR